MAKRSTAWWIALAAWLIPTDGRPTATPLRAMHATPVRTGRAPALAIAIALTVWGLLATTAVVWTGAELFLVNAVCPGQMRPGKHP